VPRAQFLPAAWNARLAALLQLIRRHPGLLALCGFVGGLASFLLVERHAGLARVIALVMLASWVWLTLENLLRDCLARRFGLRVPPLLLRYLTQLVHQESLFFVLPFFAVTTAWNSAQSLFTGLLGLAALVAITDPLYYRALAPRRGLYLAYHGLTLFAVLLVTLPLILHLSTAQSYPLALAIATLLSLASLHGRLRAARWRRSLALVALLLALAAAGWLLRAWVPPATLWMTDMQVSQRFDTRQRVPGAPLQRIDTATLRAQGLYAFSAISAPRGLNERIEHVWLHEGVEIDRITLQIRGGREQGYRAWSHKLRFPAQPTGRWQVRVQTAGGQLLGTLRFRVED
jgi:hypothetical protein